MTPNRTLTPSKPTQTHGRQDSSPSILETEGYSQEQINALRGTWKAECGTSLDPDEINVGRDGLAPDDTEIEARAQACMAFRHSSWTRFRELTAQAIERHGPESRRRRFQDCGASAWVLKASNEPGRYRLASNRCRDRFCLPCYQEYARVVLGNLRALLAGHQVRMLTLTLRSSPTPLRDLFDRILKCFRQLRQRKQIKAAMTGGVYFFEVTRNQKTGLWHPHIHVLFCGKYLPQPVVKKLWHEITEDSFVVDIRGFPTADNAIGYAAKYVSKGVGCGCRPDTEGFDEVIQAFHGRRLFSAFGSLRGKPLAKVPEDAIKWDPVGPLWKVLADAQAGSSAAREILKKLRRFETPPPIDLEFGHEKTGDTS